MNRTIQGVDYSFDRANLAELKRLGYKYVIRYLTGQGKALTVAEVNDLWAHGLAVAVCFETTGARARAGRGAGEADARTAIGAAMADKLDGIPIFMVDDANSTFAQVRPYFEGASFVLGKGRRGAYGSGLLLRELTAAGLIDFAWEAGARGWGDGTRFGGAHILQDPSGHVANASVDVNHADPSAVAAMRGGFAVRPTKHPSPAYIAYLKGRLRLRRAELRRLDRRRASVTGRVAVLIKRLKDRGVGNP